MERYKAFKKIKWPRKIITIEPVLDFDPGPFLELLIAFRPEAVEIGYNSKRGPAGRALNLPEPPLKKTKDFIKAMKANGINVIIKTIPTAL